MYKVLARKWRPQTFDELVGQRHVARSLTNALTGNRVAHAYLFAGLRGTGKTTVARILAKCLNCESALTTSPCGSCASCSEIAASRSLDVMEIDAASRTKVEQTRELLEIVSYSPVRDRYKILIIDEAHMLSKASFNALLKTLEEPPPNVVFILATTEIQKVLPTVLSRCQVFEFRRVGVTEVAEFLRRICDTEKIEITDRALDRLARAGEGSVRDSISALERVLAFSGDRIPDEDVLRMLGAVRAEVLNEIIESMARHDAAKMLSVLDGLVDEGHDLVHFWNELVAAIRDLLLLAKLPGRSELLSRSPDEAAALERSAEGLSCEDLLRIFQILAELEPGLKASSQPRFLFEATLIRLSSLAAVRPIEEFLQAIVEGDRSDSPAPRAPSPRPALESQKKKIADSTDLVTRVRNTRPMLGAVLEQASSIALEAGVLRIRFEAGMDALKRTLAQPESLELLRSEAATASGGPVTVQIEVGSGSAARPEAAATGPEPTSPGSPRFGGRAATGGLLDRIREEPGVGKLLDIFGAQVVDLRPLDLAPAATSEDDGAAESLEER